MKKYKNPEYYEYQLGILYEKLAQANNELERLVKTKKNLVSYRNDLVLSMMKK